MIRWTTEELEFEGTELFSMIRNAAHGIGMDSEFQIQSAIVALDAIRTELSSRWNIEEICKSRREFNQRGEEPCQCP